MKYLLCIIFLVFSASIQAQIDGVWKGLMFKDGQKPSQATIVYFDFGKNPISREELTNSEGFAVRVLKVEQNGKILKAKQATVLKKKDVFGVRWCGFEFDLVYVDSTGYLQGNFLSLECKGNTGKVVCFRVDEVVSQHANQVELQAWRPIFIDDIVNGRKSKEIRDKERREFVFQPIYFDYDKAEIRPEFRAFLNRIVYIINSHSDLRIKVIGNTDSDGSDSYNDELSERRSQAIIDYFVKAGLKRDRVVIEFNGERNPVSDNSSSEGKQKNRRVEFAFI